MKVLVCGKTTADPSREDLIEIGADCGHFVYVPIEQFEALLNGTHLLCGECYWEMTENRDPMGREFLRALKQLAEENLTKVKEGWGD